MGASVENLISLILLTTSTKMKLLLCIALLSTVAICHVLGGKCESRFTEWGAWSVGRNGEMKLCLMVLSTQLMHGKVRMKNVFPQKTNAFSRTSIGTELMRLGKSYDWDSKRTLMKPILHQR